MLCEYDIFPPHRVQAGHCFHLFTRHRLGQLAEYQQPEMLRTPLEELVLQIKILKLGQAEGFLQKAIEAPESRAVNNAIRCLKDLVSSDTFVDNLPMIINLPRAAYMNACLFSYSTLNFILTMCTSYVTKGEGEGGGGC